MDTISFKPRNKEATIEALRDYQHLMHYDSSRRTFSIRGLNDPDKRAEMKAVFVSLGFLDFTPNDNGFTFVRRGTEIATQFAKAKFNFPGCASLPCELIGK